MGKMILTTLGYEGLNTDQFFKILELSGVQVLVDVREKPISHKAGFAKKALSARCAGIPIDYIHIPALGSPSQIRKDFRQDGDWERFTVRYLEHLSQKEQDINELARLVSEKVGCLMCFEADYRRCHRYFIIEKLCHVLGDGLQVIYLDQSALE